MEIKNLYTLSQFVDEITLDFIEQEDWMASAYLAIQRYNEFLKQPLTREMFVCEEQSKVIFENINVLFYTEGVYDLAVDGVPINYYAKDNYWFMPHGDDLKNLCDLSNATTGQIKLKNVNL